jgi:hypothetical protein
MAAAWATWAAWADTKMVAAVCDRRRNHERGWEKFQPRFLFAAHLIKLMLTLTLLSCIKRKNNSILLNERFQQKSLDVFS